MPRHFFEQSPIKPIDRHQLIELDSHELLKSDDHDSIATFDQVRELGRWLINLQFDQVLPSNRPIPPMFEQHLRAQKATMLGKIALGPTTVDHYPVWIEPVSNQSNLDLRLSLVPIQWSQLTTEAWDATSDSLLALAAAAATAPHFLQALAGGIETTHCASKKPQVTAITPDHGAPLAMVFESFDQSSSTWQTVQQITQNRDLSIQSAAHLHGQSAYKTNQVVTAAAHSKVAAGVPVYSLLRSELPKHALYFSTHQDEHGQISLPTWLEQLGAAGLPQLDLSLVAAGLGFASQVVGQNQREKKVEQLLDPKRAAQPVAELLDL